MMYYLRGKWLYLRGKKDYIQHKILCMYAYYSPMEKKAIFFSYIRLVKKKSNELFLMR